MPQPNDAPAVPASGLSRLQGWIAGITGVLVLVPAIMNSAYDIYAKAAKLPRNESEQISAQLFKKHFNQLPSATIPVPIILTGGTTPVEVKVQIYDSGDIFVEFGEFSEWFPYPGSKATQTAQALPLSLMGTAYAQAPAPVIARAAVPGPAATGTYRQLDRYADGLLVRERLWQNGVMETKYLDPRTGEAVRTESHPSTPAERAALAGNAPVKENNVIAPINLDALRQHSALAK